MSAPSVPTGPGDATQMPIYISIQVQDNLKEENNNRVPQSSQGLYRGVKLTTDSLEVPLEYAFGINNEASPSSRPSLMPLFRTRYVDKTTVEEESIDYYVQLRNSLSDELRSQLDDDELLSIEKRDSNLVALDHSLHFQADVLTFAKKIESIVIDPESASLAAQDFQTLPSQAQQVLLDHDHQVISYLEHHLQSVGANDPSYDLLLNASNQLKEAWSFLNS